MLNFCSKRINNEYWIQSNGSKIFYKVGIKKLKLYKDIKGKFKYIDISKKKKCK